MGLELSLDIGEFVVRLFCFLILEIVGFSPLLFTAHKGISLQVFSIATG